MPLLVRERGVSLQATCQPTDGEKPQQVGLVTPPVVALRLQRLSQVKVRWTRCGTG